LWYNNPKHFRKIGICQKKSLNNQFYSNFEDFCAAIDDRINNAKEKYHEEIESLMTLRCQTFENVKFLAV